MFATIMRDARWAFRHAVRRPLFAAAVVGTLTLGIAATTMAYGLAISVLWRPLPFRDADRLVFVWEAADRDGQRDVFRVTSGRFNEWRERSQSFTSLVLFGAAGFSMDGADGATPVRGVRVSAAFFDTLGVSPTLGRTFTAADEVLGQHRVVVLSHSFWQQRLGRRPDVLGTSIRLNGLPYTVVGVMPPVVFPGWPSNPAIVSVDASQREIWVPIPRTPQLDANTRSHVFGVVARLGPGISADQATDELARMASPSAADVHGGAVTPIREQFVRDARLPLLALIGASAALLLVACANLAALQVSVFESRRGELAIRAALGATAGRLASQLAAESLLMAAGAGAVGLVVARYALAVLPARLPPTLPFLTPVDVDLRVAVVAALIALVSGLMIAAWPIGHLLRSGPAPRGVAGRARGRVFRVLVVAQVSVTVALVVSAALLVQSLWSVRAEDPGFVVDGVVTANIGLPGTMNTPARIVAFEDRIRHAFEQRSGVRAVALAYDHLLADILRDQLVARRVTADVIGGFAGSALALAALGVYGVLSMLVTSRTREIGVRLALGASPSRMAVGVVRDSAVNTAPGLIAGVVLAIAAGRLLESFLVGVTGSDPVTLALVVTAMMSAAVMAALVPALRAARVDPVVALRGE